MTAARPRRMNDDAFMRLLLFEKVLELVDETMFFLCAECVCFCAETALLVSMMLAPLFDRWFFENEFEPVADLLPLRADRFVTVRRIGDDHIGAYGGLDFGFCIMPSFLFVKLIRDYGTVVCYHTIV